VVLPAARDYQGDQTDRSSPSHRGGGGYVVGQSATVEDEVLARLTV
jgi:hypothetical protein